MIDEPRGGSHASTPRSPPIPPPSRRRRRARAPLAKRAPLGAYALALRARGSQSGEGRAPIDRGMLELFFISRIIAPLAPAEAFPRSRRRSPVTLAVPQGYYGTSRRRDRGVLPSESRGDDGIRATRFGLRGGTPANSRPTARIPPISAASHRGRTNSAAAERRAVAKIPEQPSPTAISPSLAASCNYPRERLYFLSLFPPISRSHARVLV